MSKTDLKEFGLNGQLAEEAAACAGFFAGRVLTQSRELYRVVCENGELMAEVSGRFRFAAVTAMDFPTIGDFVMLDRCDGGNGNAVIERLLPRKSIFSRKAAGSGEEEQPVAANIDTVFICMSLNNDFNPRRLERYLSVAWSSGATPVIVLTKTDLCLDADTRLSEVESLSGEAAVFAVSAMQPHSWQQLGKYLAAGQTAAFIGSSGVGKSTLINHLLGEERLATQGLRGDDKGRHTTTRRELFLLPGGGAVIDTPGMRELGLESADVGRAFSDIDELAARCRFRDCSHNGEPGCAVQRAVEDGTLSAERLASYRKLKKEARYDGLASRQIESLKMEEMFSDFGGVKNARKFVKGKRRR